MKAPWGADASVEGWRCQSCIATKLQLVLTDYLQTCTGTILRFRNVEKNGTMIIAKKDTESSKSNGCKLK